MQALVHEVERARIIVLLTAIALVAFWRTVLKWLVLLASTAIIAILGFGLIMIWQTTHHTAG